MNLFDLQEITESYGTKLALNWEDEDLFVIAEWWQPNWEGDKIVLGEKFYYVSNDHLQQVGNFHEAEILRWLDEWTSP